MYVCICNAIRDHELEDAAKKVRGKAHDVYRALGCMPQCGQCLEDADDIIADARIEECMTATA
ncbi:MAG: (2Fe-2S)-binding protein [Novosphingobium sp.]|nr:(2Fe-2S)-binding protein [Novosphingobium sp.]